MNIADEMVERAAEVGYRKYWNYRTDKKWESVSESSRQEWRDIMRAALEASLSGKEE